MPKIAKRAFPYILTEEPALTIEKACSLSIIIHFHLVNNWRKIKKKTSNMAKITKCYNL